MSDSSGRTRIEQDSEELYALEARALRHVPSAQNGKKRVAQDNMLVSISGDTVVAGGWAPLAPLQPAPTRAGGCADEAGSAGKRRWRGGGNAPPPERRRVVWWAPGGGGRFAKGAVPRAPAGTTHL